MIRRIPYDSLGHVDHGWLDARHHFSFAGYHDPDRMGFGVLRVVNDDAIAPGGGFDLHFHREMEIVTYVREGAISHRDDLGNVGRIAAGEVQVMSAGSGIRHAEHNREPETTRLYQIWIEPGRRGVEPRWAQRRFPRRPVDDALPLLVSGDAGDGVLLIHQEATLHGGRLKAGCRIDHPLRHQAYLLVSDGELELDGQCFFSGDAAAITGQSTVSISAIGDSEVVVIDVPKR